MIRGKSKACPFGLPIAYGCKCAGGSIDGNVSAISLMRPISNSDEDLAIEIIEDNWEHLDLISDAKKCPYADRIMTDESSVDCKYDPELNIIPAGNISFNGSPYYPHLYVGNTERPGYGYPLEYSSDDNESRTIYQGLYSLIG